jgi:ribosomal protein S7
VIESDILPTLLFVRPSFRQRWEEYMSDKAYLPEQVPVDVNEFARHLLALRKLTQSVPTLRVSLLTFKTFAPHLAMTLLAIALANFEQNLV